MLKKIFVSVVSFFAVFLCCACTRQGIYDYGTLERALKKEDKSFAYNTENGFFDEGSYYFFYSFNSDDDVVLRLITDENQQLTGAVVCMRNADVLTPKEKFMRMCAVITEEFFQREDAVTAIEETGLFKDEIYFSGNMMNAYKGEKYSAAFLVTKEAVCFSVLPDEEQQKSSR